MGKEFLLTIFAVVSLVVAGVVVVTTNDNSTSSDATMEIVYIGSDGTAATEKDERVLITADAINYIRPADWEKIQVMEDASAVALFNMEEEAGAILVTVDKEKVRSMEEKAKKELAMATSELAGSDLARLYVMDAVDLGLGTWDIAILEEYDQFEDGRYVLISDLWLQHQLLQRPIQTFAGNVIGMGMNYYPTAYYHYWGANDTRVEELLGEEIYTEIQKRMIEEYGAIVDYNLPFGPISKDVAMKVYVLPIDSYMEMQKRMFEDYGVILDYNLPYEPIRIDPTYEFVPLADEDNNLPVWSLKDKYIRAYDLSDLYDFKDGLRGYTPADRIYAASFVADDASWSYAYPQTGLVIPELNGELVGYVGVVPLALDVEDYRAWLADEIEKKISILVSDDFIVEIELVPY